MFTYILWALALLQFNYIRPPAHTPVSILTTTHSAGIRNEIGKERNRSGENGALYSAFTPDQLMEEKEWKKIRLMMPALVRNHSSRTRLMMPALVRNHSSRIRLMMPALVRNHSSRIRLMMPALVRNHSSRIRLMMPALVRNHSSRIRLMMPAIVRNHSSRLTEQRKHQVEMWDVLGSPLKQVNTRKTIIFKSIFKKRNNKIEFFANFTTKLCSACVHMLEIAKSEFQHFKIAYVPLPREDQYSKCTVAHFPLNKMHHAFSLSKILPSFNVGIILALIWCVILNFKKGREVYRW